MSFFPQRDASGFDFREIDYQKEGWIARVTIKRPHNYNAYSTPALMELAAAFQDASWDDRVAVVVFTGEGHRAFCTGGDVKEYQKHYTRKPRDYWKYMCCFKAYIESITNCAKPVVARLNGMAVGGGNESQLACDLARDGIYVNAVMPGFILTEPGARVRGRYEALPDEVAREVDVIDVFRPPREALSIAEQAIKLASRTGKRYVVWFQIGTASDEAVKRLTEAGLDVVVNRCMMAEHRENIAGAGR